MKKTNKLLNLNRLTKEESKKVVGGRISSTDPRDSRISSTDPRDSRISSTDPRDSRISSTDPRDSKSIIK